MNGTAVHGVWEPFNASLCSVQMVSALLTDIANDASDSAAKTTDDLKLLGSKVASTVQYATSSLLSKLIRARFSSASLNSTDEAELHNVSPFAFSILRQRKFHIPRLSFQCCATSTVNIVLDNAVT